MDDFCNMAYCSVHEKRENYQAVHFLSLSSVCPNFHWVTLVAFVMAVLQKLVLFFLQRPSWQYCAETRPPHFLLHWTGRANKHINNRWTIRQGWTPFPWGKQAALPLHPCPLPSPVPWKDSLTRGTGGAKLTQVPSKNCLFSKFEVWIFICKDSSVAHSLMKLLFSCCVVLPRPAYLCFYPALPRRSYQEKKCCPVNPYNVRSTCHESLMLRVSRWIALGKTFLRKKMFSFGHCFAHCCLHFFSNCIFGLFLHRCKCFEPWTFGLSIYVSRPAPHPTFLQTFPFCEPSPSAKRST